MNPHDRLRIVLAEARQEWRDFAYVMQAHENRYIKRAGVAGIRARVFCRYLAFFYQWIKLT
ncbi:hypothetical protein MLV05_001810 [Escherichia coli]|nr:hypothetical protein [Escherichia coli]MCV0732445.1 hypothetical protein [Escherichia coli]